MDEPLFSFARDDEPVRRPRVTPIRKIGATDQLTGIICSPTIQGFRVHWVGHTEPCRSDKQLCKLCLAKMPQKWTGFLLVLIEKPEFELVFIELTDYAYERLRKRAEEYPSLRGLQCLFVRERKTVRAPVKITVLARIPEYKQIPPEQSVEPTLRRIWNLPN